MAARHRHAGGPGRRTGRPGSVPVAAGQAGSLMPVFVRRLLGIGKLPADVRAEIEAEGIIYLADYVPVTRRFSGAIPGLRSAHSVASYVGSVALTSQRVLATLSSLPKLAGPTVDVRWDATQSGTGTVKISPDGLHVDVDVDNV